MNFKNAFHKSWPAITILLLIILSVHIRTIDYNWPYLRNIDSYTFAREIERIVENGYLPETDPFALSPNFYNVPESVSTKRYILYQHLGAYGFFLTKIIFPDIELFEYLIYLPTIIISLVAIPAYFIGRYLYDRRTGILTAFFILFNTSNIQRTLGGDPDTDAIVILIPLIVMALFLITYTYINTKKKFDRKAIFYSFLTGISLFLWSHTWVGYWYIVWLIFGFLAAKTLMTFILKQNLTETLNKQKNVLKGFLLIMGIFFVIDFPFSGLNEVTSIIQGPFNFQGIKTEEDIFPNVYVSVAELQPSGGFLSVIQRIIPVDGFAVLFSPFLLMIYGLIYLTYSYIKTKNHLDTIILLVLWFLGPFLATVVAVRFAILFSAPIAIGSAIFLAKLIKISLKEHEKISD